MSHGKLNGAIECGTALLFLEFLKSRPPITENCQGLWNLPKAVILYMQFCLEASSTSPAIRYCRIDQSTPPGEKRDAIINEFNKQPSLSVMLLGMKCGGTGRVKFLGNEKFPAN